MTWSFRKPVDHGCSPATTSISTAGLPSSRKAAGASCACSIRRVPDLQKLPAGYSARNEIPKAQPICPEDAPVKTFNVVAQDYPAMKFNPKAPEAIEVDFERKIQMANPEAKIYALEEDVAKVAEGMQPMPLTLARQCRRLPQGQSEEQDEGEQSVLLGHRPGVRSKRFARRQCRKESAAIKRLRQAKAAPTPTMRIRSSEKPPHWCGTGAM